MKKIIALSTIISTTALLSACAHNPGSLGNLPKPHQNLIKETWFNQVHLNSANWVKKAGKLNFKPSKLKQETEMHIKLKPFDKIVVNGNFNVQIMGDQTQQNISFYGSHSDVMSMKAKVVGGTLHLTSTKSGKLPLIVRVGGTRFEKIVSHDNNRILGRNLNSKNLEIQNDASGNIILYGEANLKKIDENGSGNIVIINAYGKNTLINSHGKGDIDLSGNFNIKDINSTGHGNINVIGIKSTALKIDSKGSGNIRLGGYADLKSIDHSGSGDILMYWVTSPSVRIKASGSGTIGLAGNAHDLYAHLGGKVRLDGQFLHTTNADVKTYNQAHANLTVKNQLLATSIDDSSIYFFGTTQHIMRYEQDSGLVLPLWNVNKK